MLQVAVLVECAVLGVVHAVLERSCCLHVMPMLSKLECGVQGAVWSSCWAYCPDAEGAVGCCPAAVVPCRCCQACCPSAEECCCCPGLGECCCPCCQVGAADAVQQLAIWRGGAAGVGCSAVQQLVKVLPGVKEAARRVQVLQVLLSRFWWGRGPAWWCCCCLV